MTRKSEQISKTPWARLLAAFMWNQQPPWTSAFLAQIINVHRNRAGNWLFHGMQPDLNDVISIMAQLGIPFQALSDAYAATDLPVPPLTYDDPRATVQPAQLNAILGAPPIPGQPSTDPSAEDQAQARAHAQAQAQRNDEQQRREWAVMIANTTRVMTELGMPRATVDAMLAELRQRRLGAPTPAQRRLSEELRDDNATYDPATSVPTTSVPTTSVPTTSDESDIDTTRRPRRGASSKPRPR